jgi:hypothetical protein
MNNTNATADLGLGAYLIVKGYELKGIENQGFKCLMIFDESAKFDTENYWKGDLGPALDYSEEYRKLKTRLIQIRDNTRR